MASPLSSPTETLSDRLSARRLTPEVAEVLAQLLVAGWSRQSIADRLGVSVRTVSRWKVRPLVTAAEEHLRNRSDEEEAADVLLRLTRSPDERVALRAADLILAHHRHAAALAGKAAPDTSAVVIRFEGDPEVIKAETDKVKVVDGEIVD